MILNLYIWNLGRERLPNPNIDTTKPIYPSDPEGKLVGFLEPINMYENRHRVENNFDVGDLVFVRLQPCNQYYLKKIGTKKFKPHFYGTYRVIRRVGDINYDLEIP